MSEKESQPHREKKLLPYSTPDNSKQEIPELSISSISNLSSEKRLKSLLKSRSNSRYQVYGNYDDGLETDCESQSSNDESYKPRKVVFSDEVGKSLTYVFEETPSSIREYLDYHHIDAEIQSEKFSSTGPTVRYDQDHPELNKSGTPVSKKNTPCNDHRDQRKSTTTPSILSQATSSSKQSPDLMVSKTNNPKVYHRSKKTESIIQQITQYTPQKENKFFKSKGLQSSPSNIPTETSIKNLKNATEKSKTKNLSSAYYPLGWMSIHGLGQEIRDKLHNCNFDLLEMYEDRNAGSLRAENTENDLNISNQSLISEEETFPNTTRRKRKIILSSTSDNESTQENSDTSSQNDSNSDNGSLDDQNKRDSNSQGNSTKLVCSPKKRARKEVSGPTSEANEINSASTSRIENTNSDNSEKLQEKHLKIISNQVLSDSEKIPLRYLHKKK